MGAFIGAEVSNGEITMFDLFKELIWAIVHDVDTKIILSIVMSCLAMGISIALLVAKAIGR